MRYLAPDTLEAAVGMLAEESGTRRILAGGTDVLVQMTSGLVVPDLVVDIKQIAGVNEITEEDGGYRIGAAVPSAVMNEHAGLRAMWPGVCEAADLIGSTQIQSRATIAGNLCNGSPAADSVPALFAANATARVVGSGGSRDIAVADIPAGPGRTKLDPTDIIHSIHLPAQAAGSADAYQRFIPRTEMDIAVVGVGANVTLDGSGQCTAARVALGAVAETVIMLAAAEDILVGTHLDDATLEALSAAASAACRPIDDKRGTKEFRIKVAGVLAKRVTKAAAERARGN